jgi:DUF2934 family protein
VQQATPITGQSQSPAARRRRGPQLVEPASPAAAISHDDIANRAYELFMSHGAVHDHDVEHWLEAERDLIRMREGES